MKRPVIAVWLLVAAIPPALAQRYVNSDVHRGLGLDAGAAIIKVNAPGGAYIQCGPYANSPVRCTQTGGSK